MAEKNGYTIFVELISGETQYLCRENSSNRGFYLIGTVSGMNIYPFFGYNPEYGTIYLYTPNQRLEYTHYKTSLSKKEVFQKIAAFNKKNIKEIVANLRDIYGYGINGNKIEISDLNNFFTRLNTEKLKQYLTKEIGLIVSEKDYETENLLYIPKLEISLFDEEDKKDIIHIRIDAKGQFSKELIRNSTLEDEYDTVVQGKSLREGGFWGEGEFRKYPHRRDRGAGELDISLTQTTPLDGFKNGGFGFKDGVVYIDGIITLKLQGIIDDESSGCFYLNDENPVGSAIETHIFLEKDKFQEYQKNGGIGISIEGFIDAKWKQLGPDGNLWDTSYDWDLNKVEIKLIKDERDCLEGDQSESSDDGEQFKFHRSFNLNGKR